MAVAVAQMAVKANVEDVVATRFNPGERVRIVSTTGIFALKTGTVARILSPQVYEIKLDKLKSVYIFLESELEPLWNLGDQMNKELHNGVGQMSTEIADLQHQLAQTRANHQQSMEEYTKLRVQLWELKEQLAEKDAIIEYYRNKARELRNSVLE